MSRRSPSSDAERYKKAANDALTLLDWCIEYLANNHHGRVAGQLARGRNGVHERLKRAARS